MGKVRETLGRGATEPHIQSTLKEECSRLEDFYVVESVDMEINVSKVKIAIPMKASWEGDR
jgi:hypothetical protein